MSNHHRGRPAVVAFFALTATACTRTSERVGPSPEATGAPSITVAPPPPPDLELTEVHCRYGGTAPAFFVWVEATAHTRITGLHATSYEIADKSGAFVNGVGAALPLALRVRAGKNGDGDVKFLAAPLEAGAHVHLEVFGALAFTAFGPKVDYPTDDRAFRVSLVADHGAWTITGTCVVGPAG